MDSIEHTRKKAINLRKRARQLLAFTIVTATLGHSYAYGQTFAEWFKQKSTQKKYLLQQISALLTYRQYAQHGYNIAKGGLGDISSYVGKEYNLHNGYYTNLKTVTAAVRNEPQIKEILRRQQDILSQTGLMKKQDGLTSHETQYVKTVCAALLKDCEGQLNDLQTVINDNKAEMSDEERLRHIGRIHAAMQDNYRFTAYFGNQLKMYALQKQQEQKEANTLKRLYGKVD